MSRLSAARYATVTSIGTLYLTDIPQPPTFSTHSLTLLNPSRIFSTGSTYDTLRYPSPPLSGKAVPGSRTTPASKRILLASSSTLCALTLARSSLTFGKR